MSSPQLAVPHVAASQAQKEVTINDAINRLDDAWNRGLDVSVAAGDVVLTGAQFRRHGVFRVTGASVAGRTVTVPAIARWFVTRADAANAHPVAVVRGTASRTLLPGAAAFLVADGTADGLAAPATVEVFLSLVDTPGSFAGLGLRLLRVNAGETAIEAVQPRAVRASAITVGTVASATHGPVLGDEQRYHRCTDAGGCVVTVPANSAQPFGIGARLVYEQAAAGAVSVVAGGGVTVNRDAARLAETAFRFGVLEIIKVGADEWTLRGDLKRT
jgi:hypothetical protein